MDSNDLNGDLATSNNNNSSMNHDKDANDGGDNDRHQDEQQPAVQEIEVPRESDVLCGRGGAALRHPGNQTYRSLVYNNKAIYITCAKAEKLKISKRIVAAIRSQNGRFLERDMVKGTWYDIGDKKAMEKTSQALREGQPKLRQKIVEELGGGGPAGAAALLETHLNANGMRPYGLAAATAPYGAEMENWQMQQATMDQNNHHHTTSTSTTMPDNMGRHDMSSDLLQRLSLTDIQEEMSSSMSSLLHPGMLMSEWTNFSMAEAVMSLERQQSQQQQQQQQQQHQHDAQIQQQDSLSHNMGMMQQGVSSSNNVGDMMSGGNDMMSNSGVSGNMMSNTGSMMSNTGVMMNNTGGMMSNTGGMMSSSGGMMTNGGGMMGTNSGGGMMANSGGGGGMMSHSGGMMTNNGGGGMMTNGGGMMSNGAAGMMNSNGAGVMMSNSGNGMMMSHAMSAAAAGEPIKPPLKVDRRKYFARMKTNRSGLGWPNALNSRSQLSASNQFGDGMPDIHLVESNRSIYSNVSSVGSSSDHNNNTANNTMNNRVPVNVADVWESRRSIMSGLSRISDASDGNSIISDLSKKIGNVSTRSIAMSELSNMDDHESVDTDRLPMTTTPFYPAMMSSRSMDYE